MSHSFIILDAHPSAFTPTNRNVDLTTDPTHQLPPFPLWSCMVQSTLEFCRMAWDLGRIQRHYVNVLVAGKKDIFINNYKSQSLSKLETEFPLVQPREACSHDRLQAGMENLFKLFIERQQIEKKVTNRCRIILLLLEKGADEKGFQYRNNPEDDCRDLRSMIFDVFERLNDNKQINHVQIDVLRLLTHSNTMDVNQHVDILLKKVSPQITMSIYNIPNHQQCLKYAMQNLSQLCYNINLLHISNIPMKTAGHESAQTITLYYKAMGHHLINQPKPSKHLRIYDPLLLKDRELHLVYSKRSKRSLPDTEWYTCMHPISPVKIHDPVTEVFLEMSFKGSISYLMTPETNENKVFTHILIAQDACIYLHCLGNTQQQQFATAEKQAIELVEVKVEGSYIKGDVVKTQEFLDTLIKPNLFSDIHEFNNTKDMSTKLVSFNPQQFSHHLPVTYSRQDVCTTTVFLEKATRWRTCFRDCNGTDRFPIKAERSVSDSALDVLNGIPQHSGFGLAFGLIHDLLEQLEDEFLKDNIKQVSSTEKLIDMIISGLAKGMDGDKQHLFLKGMLMEDAKMLSKKLMIGLYLVAKRFKHDSESHGIICDRMLELINEKTKLKTLPTTTENKQNEANDIDAAWSQVQKYENMSLREKEEAAQGFVPEFKTEDTFTNQLPVNKGRGHVGNKVNPNFRGRRGAPIAPTKTPRYPDPSLAVPYLDCVGPTIEEKREEEEEEEASLGQPGNLLWLYWKNDRINKRGNKEQDDLDDGAELVYKQKTWKRVKKEFFGRTAQPGEKGEAL